MLQGAEEIPPPVAPTSPKRSHRRTSKRLLGVNTLLAWGLAFYGGYQGNDMVTASALAFIAAMYGAYTGIGHLDFRQVQRNDLQ